MPNIDNLSIEFTSKGTENAVKNIKAMGYAIRNLSQTLKTIDGSKVKVFAESMATLKKSVPTKSQADRMVAFGEAVKNLSGAIGTANISSFSKDMSTLGSAVEAFKKSSVNSITNAVSAMQNLQTQTRETANTINSVTPKSQKVNLNNNKPVDMASSVKTVIPLLDKVESRTESIKSKFKGIFVPTKPFKTLDEQASKVAQKYDDLRQKMQEALKTGSMEVGDDKFKKQSAELDALRNKYNDLILKQKELALSGGAVQLNPTLKTSLEAFSSGFSKVTHLIRNGFVAGIKSANSHLKSFATRIKQTVSAAKNAITSGHKATDMAKKFASELTRMSKMLKLMIVRKALRAVIAEVGNGFQSLAIHSDEFNNAMSGLINGSKKLGYSFAAMVSPLINALAPAIVYVIELLTKLANIINQVFSALTGATVWNKAKNFTDSWRDSITGAGDAAKKTAKELKKTVLGFDELNQLQDNKDSSSGGGGGLADMFETLPIDQKWKDIADWLKKMWEIGDFYELGKKLGEKLRDWLESIPWEKIRKTANKLGGALATLINGFVEVERLGYDIGKTIAQSVNTVFEFLNGFVHRLHWDSIGKFIGETFNGFFENIDWALIKDTVVTGMAGIAEAIQNFIDTFHWDNISNFIINAVDTIVSGVKSFIEGIDWHDFGQKIGTQIRKSIEGIDWKDVGEAIGEVIQAAVDWVSGMLETLPSVKELANATHNLLTGLFEKVDSEEIGKNIATILNNIYDFLVEFWKVNGEDIKNEVKDFFKGFWDNIDKEDLKKVLGVLLSAAVIGGITSALGAFAKTFLTAKINAMVSGAAGASAPVATAGGTSLGSLLLGGISAVFTAAAVAATIKMAIDDVKSYKDSLGVDSLWQALFSPDEEIKAAKQEYAAAKSSNPYLNGTVSAGVQDVANSWTKMQQQNQLARQQDGQEVANWANETSRNLNEWQENNRQKREADKQSFYSWCEETKKNFKDWQQNNALDRQKNRDDTYKWADDVIKKSAEWKQNVNKEFEEVKKGFSTFKDDWAKKWEENKKKLSDFKTEGGRLLTDIKKDFTDIFGDIRKSMDKNEWTFEGVGEGLKSTFEKAKNGIKGVWNSIAETLNGDHEIGGSNLHIRLPKFYATGGFPEDGLFFANHSELVGTFSNGKTAVANNAQIVEGIQKGVYSAVSSAMAQNSGSSRYISNEIVVDGEVIARTVTKAQDRQDRRFSPSMG